MFATTNADVCQGERRHLPRSHADRTATNSAVIFFLPTMDNPPDDIVSVCQQITSSDALTASLSLELKYLLITYGFIGEATTYTEFIESNTLMSALLSCLSYGLSKDKDVRFSPYGGGYVSEYELYHNLSNSTKTRVYCMNNGVNSELCEELSRQRINLMARMRRLRDRVLLSMYLPGTPLEEERKKKNGKNGGDTSEKKSSGKKKKEKAKEKEQEQQQQEQPQEETERLVENTKFPSPLKPSGENTEIEPLPENVCSEKLVKDVFGNYTVICMNCGVEIVVDIGELESEEEDEFPIYPKKVEKTIKKKKKKVVVLDDEEVIA